MTPAMRGSADAVVSYAAADGVTVWENQLAIVSIHKATLLIAWRFYTRLCHIGKAAYVSEVG